MGHGPKTIIESCPTAWDRIWPSGTELWSCLVPVGQDPWTKWDRTGTRPRLIVTGPCTFALDRLLEFFGVGQDRILGTGTELCPVLSLSQPKTRKMGQGQDRILSHFACFWLGQEWDRTGTGHYLCPCPKDPVPSGGPRLYFEI